MMFLLIFVGVASLTVVVMGITVYNNLVSLKNQVERAWANIEVILKQRFDEIPQILEVVEQYASYERNTLERVISARNQYQHASGISEKMSSSNEMSLALKGLIALGEAYPDLKANQSFLQLQGRVSELESHIADRREAFNETVTNFNTRLEQIPDVFFARILGYSAKPMYRPPAEEMTRPSLKMKLG